MRAQHRVRHQRKHLVQFVQFIQATLEHAKGRAPAALERMLRGQFLQHALYRRRQGIVSGIHAREQGIPARLRNFFRGQDRTEGRRFLVGHVGMPVVLGVVRAPLRLDDGQARVAGVVIEHRVRRIQLTEIGGKSEMLFACDVLVTKKQYAEFEQCLPDLGNRCLVEGLRQVDAFDKRAEVR